MVNETLSRVEHLPTGNTNHSVPSTHILRLGEMRISTRQAIQIGRLNLSIARKPSTVKREIIGVGEQNMRFSRRWNRSFELRPTDQP